MNKKLEATSYIKAVLTIMVLGMLAGCGAFDKDETNPTYLRINSFELTTPSNNSEGSNAHDIVDAWVYVAGDLIGVFELPALVPVHASGEKVITIFAGVKQNGAANSRIVYPFYTSYIDTLQFEPGSTIEVAPKVQYVDAAQFAWIEDFEDRSISLIKSGTNTTEDSILLTEDPALVYNYNPLNKISAYAILDSGYQKFENSTIQDFELNRDVAIFLEMNYNIESGTQVGMYAFNAAGDIIGQIPVLYLFPTNGEWKKSYISLAEDINDAKYANGTFSIFFESTRSSDTATRIYIDNLKLVHF